MIEFYIKQNILNINFRDDFILYNNTIEKDSLFNQINKNIKQIYLTSNNLKKWDSSLLIIIYKLVNLSKDKSIEINTELLDENIKHLIKLAFSVDRKPTKNSENINSFFENLGNKVILCYKSFLNGLTFLKEVLFSLKRFVFSKAIVRKIDILFALEDCTYKALPIVGLINFMVGVILAFVGALELKIFGVEIYIASLVSLSMVRIMGAIMTGIIMSGRTGASYTASIGTMQVNEEIDALKTMGIPTTDFLILPRIIALIISMPILTMFSSVIGILGGAFVGIVILNLPPIEYFKMSINILNLNHFLVGIFHSFIFGIIIALCGCYYGVNCGKNADSVGKSTTNCVVSSIIWIIIATGIITFICEVLKI